jgi:hypothetical protein
LELGIKAGRKELEAGWKSLRRGWYVGGEHFRKGLLARVRQSLSSQPRQAGCPQASHPHAQSRAEEMLATGLDRLRLLGTAGQKLSWHLGRLSPATCAQTLHIARRDPPS